MKAPRYQTKNCLVDTLIKTGAGILHTLTLASDAAATAGTLTVRDGTDANGTVMFLYTIPAAFVTPVTLLFDAEFKTGLYLDFGTTDDVSVTATYK